MQQGRNDTISFKGIRYHIQTEDTGRRIETHIYVGGSIIKSYFTDYDPKTTNDTEIKSILLNQHKQAFKDIKNGKIKTP